MGSTHACGLTEAGALECWGEDTRYGLAASRSGPFSRIAASETAYCALDLDDRVSCWGLQPPTGDRGERHVGEWDSPEGEFAQVSVTTGLACGVRVDTTVQCWGDLFDRRVLLSSPEWSPEWTQEWDEVSPWLRNIVYEDRTRPRVAARSPRAHGQRHGGRGMGGGTTAHRAMGTRPVLLGGSRLCGLRIGGSVWCADPCR